MGRRNRRRRAAGGSAEDSAQTSAYRDVEGNVLELRDRLSAGTVRQLRELPSKAATSRDDAWQRREELLFERLAVSWTIAGLPLSGQKELLGRYRMADAQTRSWVRATIDEHLRAHQPDALA